MTIFVIIISSFLISQIIAAKDGSGIRFYSVNSFACTSFETFSLIDVEICMFVNLASKEGTILQLEEIANNFTLKLNHKENILNININEDENILKRRNILKRWTKLCLGFKTPKKLLVTVNHLEETLSIGEHDKEVNEQMDILGNKTLEVCIGNSAKSENSFLGEAALAQLENIGNLSHTDFNCFELLNQNFEDFKLWKLNDISLSQNDILLLCIETQSVSIQRSYVSYPEQADMCRSLHGRLLSLDEAKYLQGDLKLVARTVCGNGKVNYKISGTWIESEKEDIKSLKEICMLYDFNNGVSQQPCIVESFCSCCIFPIQIDIRLFGGVIKFDRMYTLYMDKINNIRIIPGSNSSEIVQIEENQWTLRSRLHNDEWILSNQLLPLGRKIWKNEKTNKTTILTFTTCLEEEFTCSDGSCLPFRLRCNGVVDCKDESDETECVLIEKKRGYKIEKIVPPEKDDDKPEISFYIFIFNIADISATNGKMIINIGTVFFWKDSRLKFWNPEAENEIDCGTIWSPVVKMADGFPHGMIVEHEMYRSTCRINSISDTSEARGNISENDPYMGRFIDGKDVELYFYYASEATLNCRFDLRKYPFGKQTCNLNIWSDHNSLNLGDHIMVANPYQGNESKVEYNGRKALGEYLFIESYYSIIGSEGQKDQISISIVLHTLYGYHILNNFIPSILICIISLGTLFFPLTDFNERIMVSLTALLVLAALFTQASDTSIKTSYFKYIDIWYVVYITYSFLIVITNIALRIYKKKEEEHIIAVQLTKYEEKSEKEEYTFKKTRTLNRLAITSYLFIMVVFTIMYIMLASEHI